MSAGDVEDRDALREAVIDQLQAIHALKSGSLRMFDPMLAAVEQERANPDLAVVEDLLGRMHEAFGEHRQQTAEHIGRLEARLRALGAGPATVRAMATGAVGALRAGLGRLGGQNHGANARDAFVFEHVEIATLELLERLAGRSGDHETARVARDCREDDEEMVAKINRNWDNVLSLMLASKRIRFVRPPDDDGPPPDDDSPPEPAVSPAAA